MKIPSRQLLVSALLLAALPLAIRAQADASADAKNTPSQPASASATSTATSAPAPTAAPVAAAAPSAPTALGVATATNTATPPAESAAATAASSTPASATPSTAAPATSTGSSTTTDTLRALASTDDEAAPKTPADDQDRPRKWTRRHGHRDDNDRVTIAGNSHLGKGEVADSVVAIAGNAESEGEVNDSVVAIAGNARATGPVRNAVVAVAGNSYVNSRVETVVAVFGNVELGPNAEVMGDVVSVAGQVNRDPHAIVHGNIPSIGFGAFANHIDWLQSYLTHCVLKGRPLAFGPHLAWAWYIALAFFGFYVVLALIFGRTVETNCRTLEENPGASILASILTLLLVPVTIVLLCITVVGVIAVPFLAIGLLCASIFGHVVMLAWIGRRLTGITGASVHPAAAAFVGGIVLLALYTVPFLGFVMYKLVGVLGLGVVVYTLILSSKREKAARAAAMPAPAVPPVSADVAAAAATPGLAAIPPTIVPPIALATLPRAGFWVRLGAMLIDIILVAVVLLIVHGMLPRFLRWDGPALFLVALAVYGAVMWKFKGTTVGGIICGLRVVRIDGRDIDWATAFVRAAGCFLSLIVACLGFIWVAFDDEKQSWHDKIAGTTVVHHRGTGALV